MGWCMSPWRHTVRPSGKMILLRNVPLFAELSNKELRLIETLVDEVAVPPGIQLAARGRRGMELVIIVEGQARITEGCRETTVLGPGEFFGVTSPLDGGGYWATVEAASRMRVLVAGERALSCLLEVRPCLTLRIMSGLSRHARSQDESADRSLPKGSTPPLPLRAGRYPSSAPSVSPRTT